ncbi:phosphoribosylamine--glycine ligase [Pseudothermotoga lettingae]|uniref:phosphoribosylamine--glycine ligase n=2 Tax=Pseudothermotoga TaxID=1643951 RepID=UPI00074868FD|nr:phosphoribosylamine--glycine ligase [Pseudothermotoga lettingae]KUK21866.1 MAG: Phosphoribosylamine--glycine ligase [Pseudothermotoga lettingae]MDI3494890.1 phosphoribosylamine---glycine ligase [Pseudothermotoga sp.]HBT26691.1 phosphoribosylamine--glycine ligase [Pseudothermotoga sp.]
MKILVIGRGGREHALVWKLAFNKNVSIYCVPGNGGIEENARCFQLNRIDQILDFALREKIDITIVGPENYLVDGIADKFEERGLRVFGPRKQAALVEGSKVFAKILMAKYGIPTASFKIFDDPDSAEKYISEIDKPVVVKADGLAAGKGAIVARTKKDAFKAIDSLMRKKIFKEAGDKVVIEDFLEGFEVSALAFCDGKTIVPMLSSMDYKRAYDGNKGPNTGGMGSVTPAPHYTDELSDFVYRKIMFKMVEALQKEDIEYKGILYAGLMITKDGPKVLEFNCRFGDPETQSILLLLENDLLEIVQSVIEGELSKVKISWSDEKAVCLVIASGGYPESYTDGYEIYGLDKIKDAVVFHAGTKRVNGKFITAGGRVLNICSKARTYSEAAQKVYKSAESIYFEGMHYRKDIADFKV